MNDSSPPAPAPTPLRRRLPAGVWGLLLIALAVLGALAWRQYGRGLGGEEANVDLSPEALDARLLQAEAQLSKLQRGQASVQQGLSDNRSRTNLLRDEMLGITQRSALLEDSVQELASERREGAEALRLDEADLLLTLAAQRLRLAGDVPGAIRATELADSVLATLRDPALLNLRQSLAQELAALRALPKDPKAVAAGELDALEALLPRLAAAGPAKPAGIAQPVGASGFERLLNALVQVRPSGEQDLVTPADRSTGEAGLALEIALARTALERRDGAALQASLARIDSWLRRLYADSPLLRERRERLKKLATQPLAMDLPVAGASLEQLHLLQRSRQAGR
jgi:uroporphyrin-3 C-methyltransferase